MEKTVKYLEDFQLFRSTPKGARMTPWGLWLPGQNQYGYGSKITTDLMLIHKGRKYRVYGICWSNSASHYVTIKGERYFLPTVFSDEVLDKCPS